MFYKYCNFLMLEGVADGRKYAKGDVTPFMIEKMSNVLLFFFVGRFEKLQSTSILDDVGAL